jgi:hypothetical protein
VYTLIPSTERDAVRSQRNEQGFRHTSVTGVGSLARRAAFLDQSVFPSDLIYVEPVFLGFNLIADASKRDITQTRKAMKCVKSQM